MLSKHQGQLGVRLGYKWNRFSVPVPMLFYLLGPHFLSFLLHIYIKDYATMFHFFASLISVSWNLISTRAHSLPIS